jgi:[protein-PII] uridylyltransferase
MLNHIRLSNDWAVSLENGDLFLTNASRLLDLFLYSKHHGLYLHPNVLQQIRELVLRMDWNILRNDPVVKEKFLELFCGPGRVAKPLRQMHEVGLLARLIPAFEHITGLVQHEFFHRYTADEHTLVCLEKLDAIWNEQLPDCGLYTDLFRQVPRPELLYLALLLHDTGKGEGRDHAEKGAHIAAAEGQRLGLPAAEIARVVFLVRHHLSMVILSQKRDLDDPEVIRGFAELVGDTENLRMLTLHTLADSLGTSDSLWNTYKDQLLRMLYTRTLQYLTGIAAPTGAARRHALWESLRQNPPAGLASDEIEAHFQGLPDNYFPHLSRDELLADLEVVHDFLALQVQGKAPALAPAIRTRDLPERGCTVVRVCTWDHSGLFARLAAALSASGLGIHSAEIYTRSDHLVLDRFYVAPPGSAGPAPAPALEQFRLFALQALSGELALPELLRLAGRQHEPRTRLEPITPRITFDNQASAKSTILEIQAEDRLGLLAALAAALAEMGVDISLAKINTTHGVADDAFYVTDADGRQILAPERQEQIRARLIEALASLG